MLAYLRMLAASWLAICRHIRICMVHVHADVRERGRRACIGQMKIGSLLQVKCIETMHLTC